MGAAFTFVLVCSNIMISLLRKVIPGKVHLPCYIVIIASFVTIVQMFMQAYMESLCLTGKWLECSFYRGSGTRPPRSAPRLFPALPARRGAGIFFTAWKTPDGPL